MDTRWQDCYLCFLSFFSDEGENKLDSTLGDQRLVDFIHCFELLILLENFCKQRSHNLNDLRIMKKGIPLIMDFIKKTMNRREGNGMKIIKFHLLLHLVDDIKRFGSMRNYDSCIGERHHCTEIKDPAQQTQRRKVNFEKQTALRYYDNVLISIGQREFPKEKKHGSDILQYKNKNIIYDDRYQQLYKKDSRSKKLVVCKWQDKSFQKSLICLCKKMVREGNVVSPIKFFTQHNRESLIFRGCPDYQGTGPWYDWANVDWGDDEPVPAKILIFMDLSDNFIKPFQVGTSFVTEASYYAVAHTCNTSNNIMGHLDSMLVEFNTLLVEKENSNQPQLCMFSVDTIISPCVAVPYKTTETIVNAIKWCFLRQKHHWQEQLLKLLDGE